jgi:hypothetical protein
MALVRSTPETAELYAASLTSATESADTAVRVMDETARIAVIATGLLAACRGVAHEEAMESVFRQIEDAQEEES